MPPDPDAAPLKVWAQLFWITEFLYAKYFISFFKPVIYANFFKNFLKYFIVVVMSIDRGLSHLDLGATLEILSFSIIKNNRRKPSDIIHLNFCVKLCLNIASNTLTAICYTCLLIIKSQNFDGFKFSSHFSQIHWNSLFSKNPKK